MSSSISYANAAAKGLSPDSTPPAIAKELDGAENAVASETPVEQTPLDVSDKEVSVPSTGTTDPPVEPESEGNGDKKEKKVLAPAPVPEKSAWGASAATGAAAAVVDDHKWPTPDEVGEMEQLGQKSAPQKFIKQGTNKWLPMNAKVMLASTRSSGGASSQAPGANAQQKNRRKNKNTKKKAAAVGAAAPQDAIAKKEEFVPVDAVPGASEQFVEGQELLQNQYLDQQQHNAQYGFQPKYNNSSPKNFRRYNGEGFKPRYPQQQPVPGAVANGFFHPQPYAQNAGHQNFNRQFRPQGSNQGQAQGQFRRNNSFPNPNARNGFQPRNGSFGMPSQHMPVNFQQQPQAQIPPPISPQQSPLEALTQQIDYYFSLENLIKDTYLRKKFDPKSGYTDLEVVLDFKRVKIIINGILNSLDETDEAVRAAELNAIILGAIKNCENLDINYLHGKDAESAAISDIQLRVKGNYEQWLMPEGK